jgi:hypothetical protein
MLDIRNQYIAQVVGNKSFAEVGGLWGTVNEKVSVAHQGGATALTMIDITSVDHDPMQLWSKFRDRMKDLAIQNYHCMSQDICRLLEISDAPQFDVVHCSGVLYHHPNPILLLAALRRITRCHLVLTSAVAQQVIQNDLGAYHLPPSAALFVPALSEQEFQVQSCYWKKVVTPMAQGLTERSFFDLNDFGPWWWLPTPSTMLAMCETVGFKAVDLDLTWNNNALTILLETVPNPPEDRTPQVLARSKVVHSKLWQIEQTVSQENSQTSQSYPSTEADLRAKLRHTRTRVKRLQGKLRQSQEALKQAENQIAAMKSSKFWQLRTRWIKLKNRLGLPKD